MHRANEQEMIRSAEYKFIRRFTDSVAYAEKRRNSRGNVPMTQNTFTGNTYFHMMFVSFRVAPKNKERVVRAQPHVKLHLLPHFKTTSSLH